MQIALAIGTAVMSLGALIVVVLLLRRMSVEPNGMRVRFEGIERGLERIERSVRDEVRAMTQDSRAEMRRVMAMVDQRLEEVRATVDEKLQGTLEKRLGESFKLVS